MNSHFAPQSLGEKCNFLRDEGADPDPGTDPGPAPDPDPPPSALPPNSRIEGIFRVTDIKVYSKCGYTFNSINESQYINIENTGFNYIYFTYRKTFL
jgi:hypothetical protein